MGGWGHTRLRNRAVQLLEIRLEGTGCEEANDRFNFFANRIQVLGGHDAKKICKSVCHEEYGIENGTLGHSLLHAGVLLPRGTRRRFLVRSRLRWRILVS